MSWMPSYGPEMRGGTASCTVIVADRPIGSPIVDVADSVIALNPPSMAKFEPLARAGRPARRQRIAHRGRAASHGRRGRGHPVHGARARRPATIGWSASSPSARSSPAGRSSPPTSVRQALVELVGRHHPELVAADLEAFGAGFVAAGQATVAALAETDA